MKEIIRKLLKEAKTNKSYSYLIDYYYREYTDCDEDDSENMSWPFFEEMRLPVEERPSGIFVASTELLNLGYDIDDAYDLFDALMLAVGNADAQMTEYLIRNGADPTIWAGYEEQEWWEKRKNNYLESIDIDLFNETLEKTSDMNFLQALADTAHVLVDKGGLRNFGGYCLVVDENGKIDIHAVRLKY